MDEVCGICGAALEPGSFPQLMFDGSWICESCVKGHVAAAGGQASDSVDRDNE